MWFRLAKCAFTEKITSEAHMPAEDRFDLRLLEWVLAQQHFNLLSV